MYKLASSTLVYKCTLMWAVHECPYLDVVIHTTRELLLYIYNGVWERIHCTFTYYACASWFLYFSFFGSMSRLGLYVVCLTGVGFIGQSRCTN